LFIYLNYDIYNYNGSVLVLVLCSLYLILFFFSISYGLMKDRILSESFRELGLLPNPSILR
jgi:hypothetical protein